MLDKLIDLQGDIDAKIAALETQVSELRMQFRIAEGQLIQLNVLRDSLADSVSVLQK